MPKKRASRAIWVPPAEHELQLKVTRMCCEVSNVQPLKTTVSSGIGSATTSQSNSMKRPSTPFYKVDFEWMKKTRKSSSGSTKLSTQTHVTHSRGLLES